VARRRGAWPNTLPNSTTSNTNVDDLDRTIHQAVGDLNRECNRFSSAGSSPPAAARCRRPLASHQGRVQQRAVGQDDDPGRVVGRDWGPAGGAAVLRRRVFIPQVMTSASATSLSAGLRLSLSRSLRIAATGSKSAPQGGGQYGRASSVSAASRSRTAAGSEIRHR
jgi:hypothetical protein